jgi:hypothetical protein
LVSCRFDGQRCELCYVSVDDANHRVAAGYTGVELLSTGCLIRTRISALASIAAGSAGDYPSLAPGPDEQMKIRFHGFRIYAGSGITLPQFGAVGDATDLKSHIVQTLEQAFAQIACRCGLPDCLRRGNKAHLADHLSIRRRRPKGA